MRDLRDSAHGGPRDWVSQYGIIAFVCTVTSRRVGCWCTVRSFTTLDECGLRLSLGLRPMKTHSSIQEMYEARSVSRRVMLIEMKTHGQVIT